jgi:hypothetical protein
LNKIVARFRDGRLLKGSTSDFVAAKEFFHVSPADDVGAKPTLVHVKDLKAVFFVKDFAGRPDYNPTNEFDGERPPPGRPGFFMVPADSAANIERCYVVAASTSGVTLL